MRKAGLVSEIKGRLKATHSHLQTADIIAVMNEFIEVVKEQFTDAKVYNTDNVKKMGGDIYIRGFGSFIAKVRARKMGRNIKKNKAIEIPEHTIVAFKPAKTFADAIKKINVKGTSAVVEVPVEKPAKTKAVAKEVKEPKAPKAK